MTADPNPELNINPTNIFDKGVFPFSDLESLPEVIETGIMSKRCGVLSASMMGDGRHSFLWPFDITVDLSRSGNWYIDKGINIYSEDATLNPDADVMLFAYYNPGDTEDVAFPPINTILPLLFRPDIPRSMIIDIRNDEFRRQSMLVPTDASIINSILEPDLVRIVLLLEGIESDEKPVNANDLQRVLAHLGIGFYIQDNKTKKFILAKETPAPHSEDAQ